MLDLPRMHREMRAIELLAEESPRAAFFAASRRLALDLLRGRTDTLPALRARRRGAAPADADPRRLGVLHDMVGYTAFFAGDAAACAAEAPAFEAYAVGTGGRLGPRRGGDDLARRGAAGQGSAR